VRAVSLVHVPSNGGLVNPAEEVGALCRRFGALYLLDACQSVGQLPVDVRKIGCDALCTTGRKYLRGPRGTGFLYVRQASLEGLGEPPTIDHHGAALVTVTAGAAAVNAATSYRLSPNARRFEFWESNVAGRLGLGAAIRYALAIAPMAAVEKCISLLAESLRAGLRRVPGVVVRDLGRRRCGIVSFTLPKDAPPPVQVQAALARRGVFVSASGAASTPLDAANRGLAAGVLRASVHYYNTDEEVERFLEELRRVLSEGGGGG
ncbi:unnamed protein product, partial [Phaeothamnion confervicola]